MKNDIIETLKDTEYKTEFADIEDHPLKHLGGKIEKWAINRERMASGGLQANANRRPTEIWERTGETATSELIVTGHLVSKHDTQRALLAVTSAHLLLGEDTTKKLVATASHRKATKFLNKQRKKVNIRVNRNTYRLRLWKNRNEEDGGDEDHDYVDLSNPPMLSYHYYRHNNRQQLDPRLFKRFRNDIVLWPIEQSDEIRIGDHGQHKILSEVNREFSWRSWRTSVCEEQDRGSRTDAAVFKWRCTIRALLGFQGK